MGEASPPPKGQKHESHEKPRISGAQAAESDILDPKPLPPNRKPKELHTFLVQSPLEIRSSDLRRSEGFVRKLPQKSRRTPGMGLGLRARGLQALKRSESSKLGLRASAGFKPQGLKKLGS